MTRRCDNWLATFRDWSLPRSESPESYHLWAGLFTMASVFRRQIKLPKAILGGWEVSPTLFIIFVAPPGKARKSTTASYSEELLREIPIVERCATSITKEQLLKKLSDSKDSSLSIFSSEFAMFIQKSGFDMYDVLTHLFDANRDVSVETIGRTLDFAEKPCVNLLACTTPDWVANNMPETVIGGGFASRVIFVFEEKSRRHKLIHAPDELDWPALDKMKIDLVSDLIYFSNLVGEFQLAPGLGKWLDNEDSKAPGWYQKHMNGTGVPTNYRLQGYHERKPAHMFKLAMLLHLSYSDELMITQPDVDAALDILESLELKLPRTFENIGKNPYATDIMRILDFIKMKGEASMRDVLRQFYQAAEAWKLRDLIQGLVDMGEVGLYVDKDDPNNNAKTILRYKKRGVKV